MKEIRVFVDQPLSPGRETVLDERASHYLKNVLRLRRDDRFHAFDGEGGCYIARLTSISKKAAVLLPEQHVAGERESSLDVTLVQGIARGQKMDYTIQKAVELGVNRIVPVVTEFSQVKLDAQRADKRLSHWRGVVISACEQCGRNRLPVVEAPLALDEWLETGDENGGLMLQPGAALPLAGYTPETEHLTLLIGPEGGLSEADCRAAEHAGYRGVSLGPRILRTETAAVAALAACQTLWGDFRGA